MTIDLDVGYQYRARQKHLHQIVTEFRDHEGYKKVLAAAGVYSFTLAVIWHQVYIWCSHTLTDPGVESSHSRKLSFVFVPSGVAPDQAFVR